MGSEKRGEEARTKRAHGNPEGTGPKQLSYIGIGRRGKRSEAPGRALGFRVGVGVRGTRGATGDT